MILNIGGIIRTYNLISILLFESEFKFANKLCFVIRLTKRVESSGVLPQEQHNGRLVHTSIEVEVLRVLFFEYVM